MSRFSYKTLFIILFFLLIAIIILLKFIFPNQKVSAAWWNDSWNYRKSVTVTNASGSTLVDFSASISIGTSTLFTAGKIQSDCDDIRVTDEKGTPLSYWIEPNTCNTDTTKILVQFKTLPTTGATIYFYYGNPSASSGIDSSIIPKTCSDINAFLGTGIYYIDPDGPGGNNPIQAYCDMTTNGGGWTLVASWATAQEWTKTSTSTNALFDTTAKNAVSSNFGNASINDFRVLASDAVITVGTSAYADWYYHYNTSTTWKEVWAPSGNLGGDANSGYRSTSPRQALKPFNYSYNLKFSYQVTQTWNNLSDWGLGLTYVGCLPDYWKALTTSGNSFGVYSLAYYNGSNGNSCSSAVSDGSLGICPSNQANCNTGQDMATNQSKIGYDDGVASAAFGDVGTTSVGHNPPVQATTKLWWFIRKQTPVNVNYSFGSPAAEEIGTAPIAYWKFDEGIGTSTSDSTVNKTINYFGAGDSAPTWAYEDQCISGKCLNFDGSNDLIWSSLIGAVNVAKDYSFSMWIKTTSQEGGLFKNGSGSNRNVAYIEAGVVVFGYYDGVSWHGVRANEPNLFNNSYHFLSFVKQGTNLTIYIDNKANNTSGSVYTTGYSAFGLGHMNGGSPNTSKFFNGFLDEVKIYPYARTAAQIKMDYNSRGSSQGSSANLGVKSSTAPDLNSKLIAYWKFDEGNGTSAKNSSSIGSILNVSLGTSSTIPTWSDGKFGKALSFGTNSLVQVSNNYAPFEYRADKNISLSAWIKVDPSESDGGYIFSKPWNGGGVYNYSFKYNSNKTLTLSIGSSRNGYNLSTTTTIPPTEWHHVVGTIDSNQNLNIYIDGKLSKSGTVSLSDWVMTSSNVNLVIGCIYPYGGYCNAGTSNAFNGLIDEVKIYNSALSSDEIKQDYNQGSAIKMGSTNQTIGNTITSLEYCIPGDTSPCASPVAEWNFEENTGTVTKDSSGNNLTGTFGTGNSAPTWTVGKKSSGAALNFDGKQKITINDNTLLKPTTAITTQAWFNTTDKTISQRIISKTESSGYQISLNENGGCPSSTLCFLININSIYYSASYSLSNLSNNTWYHVAGTYDGSTVKLFLNGSNIGTTASIANAITQGAYNMCIGSETDAGTCTSGFFNGKIDGVKIYNYARTPAQVAYDYNKGAPIGWWKFDECQGNIANDSSGIGNTGSISIGQSGTQNSIGTCQIGTSAAWTNGASGKINASLNFDGNDDYVAISPVSIQNIFTLNVWINRTGSLNSFAPLIEQGGTKRFRLNFLNANRFCFGYDSVTDNFYCTQNLFSSTNFWYHVVAIFDNSPHLFVNGIEYPLTQVTSAYGSWTTNQLNIGYRPYTASVSPFNGKIDDVRIYNYALTDTQVKILYNNGAVSFQ